MQQYTIYHLNVTASSYNALELLNLNNTYNSTIKDNALWKMHHCIEYVS